MITGTPQTTVTRPQYAEGSSLRAVSVRDSRNVSQQWKKSEKDSEQAFGTNRTLAKVQRDISRLKHRVLGMTPSANPGTIIPFAFYNVAPSATVAINSNGLGYDVDGVPIPLFGGELAPGSSETTIVITAVSDSGSILSAKVDNVGVYTVPPDFPADLSGGAGTDGTVTLISAADEFRTFSMRGGIIALRSRFFDTISDGGPHPVQRPFWINGAGNSRTCVGNLTCEYFIEGDALQSFEQVTGDPPSNPIMLGDNNEEFLITGFDDVTGDYFNYTQVLLNAKLDADFYCASFWLEIVDDPDSPGGPDQFQHVNLKGKMFDYQTQQPFPLTSGSSSQLATHVNIIPISLIVVENSFSLSSVDSNTYRVEQYLTGNLLNLFDSYFNTKVPTGTTDGGLALGATMHFRGDWDEDSLTGQYFYPGDFVTSGNKSTSDSGGFNIKLAYVAQNWFKATAAPAVAPSGQTWLKLTG